MSKNRLDVSTGHMARRAIVLQRTGRMRQKGIVLSSLNDIELLETRVDHQKEQIRDLLLSVGVTEPPAHLETGRLGVSQKLPRVEEVEENLRILVDFMKISITDIKDIVQAYPELLLNQKPEDLMDRYDELLAAWPSEAQLKSSIRSYPMILGEHFTLQLQKSLSILRDVGFESKQIAQIIVKQPDIVMLRKFELNNMIKRLSLDIHMDDETKKRSLVLRFLSRNPEALVPQYFKDVLYTAIERMHSELGISLSAAVLGVIQHDKLYKKCINDFDSLVRIMQRLSTFCGDASFAVQMVQDVPQILSMDSNRLDQSLQVLRSTSPEAIASYPRVFFHDPFEVVGPRISFIEEHWKGKGLQLATFLSLGEKAFLSKYVRGKREEYIALLHRYKTSKEAPPKKEISVEKHPEKKQQSLKPQRPPDVSQQKAKPRRFMKKRMKPLPRLSS